MRLQSKEYRAYLFHGGTPGDWPGVDVLEAPDRDTARKSPRKASRRTAFEGLRWAGVIRLGPRRIDPRALGVVEPTRI